MIQEAGKSQVLLLCHMKGRRQQPYTIIRKFGMPMQHLKYDIVGDIHGHADTLEVLFHKLGYSRKFGVYRHPEGRKMVFVGDFIDRGPKIRETLHLVRAMIESGNALAVMGNLGPAAY